jgi:hypothetical protein
VRQTWILGAVAGPVMLQLGPGQIFGEAVVVVQVALLYPAQPTVDGLAVAPEAVEALVVLIVLLWR